MSTNSTGLSLANLIQVSLHPLHEHIAAPFPIALPVGPATKISRGVYVTPSFYPEDGSDPYQIEVTLLPEAWRCMVWGRWGLDISASDWNGEANTEAILRADPDNKIARFLKELQIDGRSGFYWGAKREIDHIHRSMGQLVRAFLPDVCVWSSTQYSATSAWGQTFSYGDVLFWVKSSKASVLALRRLSN